MPVPGVRTRTRMGLPEPGGPPQPLLGCENEAPAGVVALVIQRHLEGLELGCESVVHGLDGGRSNVRLFRRNVLLFLVQKGVN